MRVRGCEVRGVEVERQFKFILHTIYTFICKNTKLKIGN